MIDLKQHQALWEDFYDVLVAEARSDEPLESLEEVERRLKDAGKLRGSEDLYRIRVGDDRVVYTVSEDGVTVIGVRHPSSAYR